MSNVILLVEDDSELREGVHILLSGEGYTVIDTGTGGDALKAVNDSVDLVVLDVMLPDMSDLTVCEEVRRLYTIPILFLTAKALESDKAIALTAGGDDYLTKPFSYAELIARVKAQLRRYCIYRGKTQSAVKPDSTMIQTDRIRLMTKENKVYKDGSPVELTDTEYRILAMLMKHPKRIFSAAAIYEYVWDEPYTYSSGGTVTVHIRKLRQKIEDDPQNPRFIRNIWGKGYLFES